MQKVLLIRCFVSLLDEGAESVEVAIYMETIGEGRHFERGLDTEMWKDGEVATQKALETSGFAGAFEITSGNRFRLIWAY